MNGLGRRVLFFSIGLLLTALQAHAGGLWLTLQPTPDMGVGGAGSQAAGFDASTATANPAAMTRQDRSQVETGIMGIYVDSQFNVKTPAGGNDGGNAGYFSPVPMASGWIDDGNFLTVFRHGSLLEYRDKVTTGTIRHGSGHAKSLAVTEHFHERARQRRCGNVSRYSEIAFESSGGGSVT